MGNKNEKTIGTTLTSLIFSFAIGWLFFGNTIEGAFAWMIYSVIIFTLSIIPVLGLPFVLIYVHPTFLDMFNMDDPRFLATQYDIFWMFVYFVISFFYIISTGIFFLFLFDTKIGRKIVKRYF